MSGLNGSVDLVIPAWNAHATIDRALASAAMQTEKPTVVIADDASGKSYADVAARWRGVLEVRLVRLDENGGVVDEVVGGDHVQLPERAAEPSG